ncbi:Hsp70 family protein [Fodinicola acaciae]|uniref:Hsp70 family protein n=1 Tax=Fodinicola acaciae TaxID=2681555 RepID=UPI0013D886FC|nr:Hsp70 family protein [Fodinicola acaciae]
MTNPGTNKVYGIDLGTTYSCIAQVDEYGRPAVIPNADSQPATPSVVMFDSPTDIVVGIQAKRNARVRPDDVVSLVKRHMGDDDWRVRVHGQDYSAPAISSLILRALTTDAERATGQTVTDVVITVPAYFGDAERKATKLAGELAGLNVVDIINEPTAAAFAYGFAQAGDTAEETVLVYDLGGGTFDVTVIKLAAKKIQVVATDGDHELGGADWDDQLTTYLSAQFVAEQPDAGDPLDDTYGAQDLLTMAEETKQSLTGREQVDAFVIHNGGRASITVTRQAYEELTASLLERTIELTKRVLATAAERGAPTIDKVLLVGGMSKSPAVARRLQEEFGFTPQLADPDLAVAKGAAIYGQKKELEAFVESAGGTDKAAAVRDAAAKYGLSATAAAVLVDTEVSNVTSRGFGLALADGSGQLYVEFLAHANDTLPVESEQRFFTVADNQTEVLVEVYEQATADESERIGDNKKIVEGRLLGIPAGQPKGTPVDVRFAMGRDQTIEVTARHSAVHEPLVLRVEAGMASDEVRNAERAKVDLLKPKA